MKTIAYIDKGDGNKTLRVFKPGDDKKHLDTLFMQKRQNRIQEALSDLRHMGNIKVYYVNGNKTRFLWEKGF